MSQSDCYTNIIGLSRTECACYDPKPFDTDVSNSGRYIDELQPLDRLQGLSNCENGDVWNVLGKSRENAIFTFISDFKRRILMKYRRRNEDYVGSIGKVKYEGDKSISMNYAGVRIMVSNVKHGVFKINKIGTLFNFTGTIDLMVYNSNNEYFGTYTLNTSTNKHTLNDVVIELPTGDGYVDYLEYYFIYQKPIGLPKQNDFTCNCGGNMSWGFNYSNPCFLGSRVGWQKWAQVSGVEVDSLDFNDVDSNFVCSQAYGLTFDVEFLCDFSKLLCDETMEYQYSPMNMSIADAIWYKSGELVLRSLIASTDLNRVAMINTEAMGNFISDYSSKYEILVSEIIETIDISQSDCLACRDNFGMKRHTLR